MSFVAEEEKERSRRYSCKYFKKVEMMFVTWSKPKKVWICDLLGHSPPSNHCLDCDRWEEGKSNWERL